MGQWNSKIKWTQDWFFYTELENDLSYIDKIERLVKECQSLTDVGEEQSKHMVSGIRKYLKNWITNTRIENKEDKESLQLS